MSALLLYGYGAIALCLVVVAAHDLGVWLDRRQFAAFYIRIEYTTEIRP